ncbi:MAG: MATE family efflux transporter [Algibacter sp.]
MGKLIESDKGSISSVFFKYYIPTLISLLSITVHQIIDGIILGKYVGKFGTASLGLFLPIITIFIAFGLVISVGGGIFLSKSFGAKNYKDAQEVFQFTTTLAVLLGLVIIFTGPFFTESITYFLTDNYNSELFKNATDYTFFGFLWIPFLLIRMVWGTAISHDGAPKVSRNASLVAVILNISLDFLLVIVIPLGTKGASIATGISILASLLYLYVYINKNKGNLSFIGFKFRLKFKKWKELFYHGMPSFVSEISFSVALMMLNKSLIPFGVIAVSVFGIINYLSVIFLRLFTGAMISILPIISFNIGASLPDRVIKAFRFSLLFTLGLGIVVASLGFLCPRTLIEIFINDESENFYILSSKGLSLFFLLFLAAGPNYIFGAYLQSIGKTKLSITVHLLKGIILVGLLLLLLPEYFNMGINGVWLSRSFAEIITLFLIVIYTFSYKNRFFSRKTILK